MTYCVAWKYQGTAFIVADSAATKSVLPSLPRSSVGEAQQFMYNYSVEESLLKIVTINNNIVVAYSGDVLTATSIIDFIKNSLGLHGNVGELIKSISLSLGPFDKEWAVSLIIANILGNDVNLVKWDSNNQNVFCGGNDVFQIGNLQTYHSSLTHSLLSLLVSGKLPIERMLPIVTAIIQSYGVHDNMMSHHIGGMIYGISLSKHDGVRWQEDIKYVLYDPEFNKYWCHYLLV